MLWSHPPEGSHQNNATSYPTTVASSMPEPNAVSVVKMRNRCEFIWIL